MQAIKNPKVCIVLLTLGCNLRCKMCHLWRNDESSIIRPSLSEWEKFIVSLSAFSAPGLNVIFGGGEPLLFHDILGQLISCCSQKGIRTSLATSGYLLDQNMAKRLVESGLNYIALTLYSLRKETHNFLRGMPDSFEKLFQAIQHIGKFRDPSILEIAVDTVIMNSNVSELLELADWARQDSRIHSIFFQAVMQPFHSRDIEDWYKTEEYGFLWPRDINRVDHLIDNLIKSKIDSFGKHKDKINNPISQLVAFKSYFRKPNDFIKKFSCNITNGDTFTVSPEGSVNLCPYMKPIGNIRYRDIKDIWYSQEAMNRREEISLCKKNCHHIINCCYEEERQGDK